MARLTIRDEAAFRALLNENQALLRPELSLAAANMSRDRCDHTDVLQTIAAMTHDPTATAYGAEFAARRFRNRLEPVKAAEALELAAKSFAALLDMPSRARNLVQLGQVRRELGEEERALELYAEAYRLLDVVHDSKHRDLAKVIRLKTEIYCDRNEVQRALNDYMKSIEMLMNLPSKADEYVDVVSMGRLMARIDLLMGHPDDARERLMDDLFLLGEVDRTLPNAETDSYRARTLRDLGLLELRRGQLDQAKNRLDAALDIQMRREGAVHPETIATLLALGNVCAVRGEPGQSEFFARQGIIFLTHRYGAKHPALIKAWSDRTAVHMGRGNYRDAAEEIALGLKAARVNLANEGPTAEDYFPSRDAVKLLARRGELSLQAADRTKQAEGQLKSLRSARDHYALAEGVFNRLRGSMPGDVDRLLAGDEAPDFYAGQLACLVRLLKLDPKSVDPRAAFDHAERATARSLMEQLGDEITARVGGMPDALRAQHRQLRIQLESIWREYNQLPFQLDQTGPTPEQQAVLEKRRKVEQELRQLERELAQKYPTPSRETGFPVCNPEQALTLLGPNEVAVTYLTAGRESFAVVLSRGVNGPEISVHSLPARDAIEDQIATLTDPGVMDQAMGRQLGEQLYDRLLQPIGQRIVGKDLVIVPTGPLCRLPFELLRSPGPDGRQYLGLVQRIRYAPSMTVLRLLQERDRANRVKPDLPLWVMANPEVPSLPRLPRAILEANTIAATLNADPAKVRVGKAATRSALLDASAQGNLKRHRILHFAVHAGSVSAADPRPGLILGGDRGRGGFVNVDEIAYLDINPDLVVLSACTSGGGRLYGGEGIRGLTSSFLVAGARAVIATHWPLADEGAAPFMGAFYRRLQAGTQPVDALWETRREFALQADPRPPSEWAAYVLVGQSHIATVQHR